MAELLVSVRSPEEASAALEGGAAVIDVKEPSRGSLGRADAAVLAAVVKQVGSRAPISAALGELRELAREQGVADCDLAVCRYLKVGLAGCGGARIDELERLLQSTQTTIRRPVPAGFSSPAQPSELLPGQWVAVAYADWQRAAAPRPQEVVRWATDTGKGALLVDTWKKDGSTLLDWLDVPALARLCEPLRTAGRPIALAGRLGPKEIERLLPLEPDLFAVRGAACHRRRRESFVDAIAVRHLVDLLARK